MTADLLSMGPKLLRSPSASQDTNSRTGSEFGVRPVGLQRFEMVCCKLTNFGGCTKNLFSRQCDARYGRRLNSHVTKDGERLNRNPVAGYSDPRQTRYVNLCCQINWDRAFINKRLADRKWQWLVWPPNIIWLAANNHRLRNKSLAFSLAQALLLSRYTLSFSRFGTLNLLNNLISR